MKSLELTFTHFGTVELTEGDDILWASDEDEDFKDDFEDEILTAEDAEPIINWLLDHDALTEHEAARLQVYSEDENDTGGEVIDVERE